MAANATMPESEFPSLFSPYYTATYNSLSCYAPMKPVHVAFAYVMVISGFFCFISRMIPAIKFLHAWSGRIYILAMIWATATSILISNTGLPNGTIVSFVFVLVGLTIGWVVIVVHQKYFFNQTVERVEELVRSGDGIENSGKQPPLKQLFEQARVDVNNSKTFMQRFISLKSLHGTLMFLSWINVAGRAFVSSPASAFYCYTYPVYKPIVIEHPKFFGSVESLIPVPASSANYYNLPWAKTGLVGWGLMMTLVPLGVGLIVSALAALYDSRRARKAINEQPNSLPEQPLQP